ncbi:MAG: AraC family transcriptional regulator [Xanthomonadaceae bacterium]|nr:AraC family transcriptional regulator [Xanthomonadaceae bacterium]
MTVLVRSSCLGGYPALASALGIDVAAELQRAGLSIRQLDDAASLIPYPAMMALLERAAVLGACPDFGIRLAQSQDIGVLGPLALLIRHAGTMGEAFRLASQYIFVHSPAVKLAVTQVAGSTGLVDLVFALEIPERPPCAQTVELSLALMVGAISLLSRGRIVPLQVLFPHARVGSRADYARAFGCECRFAMPQAAVRLPGVVLQTAPPEHNPALLALARQHLEQSFGPPNLEFADHVRAALRQRLGTSVARKADVARALSVHPKTLQRRLADEGQTFDATLDAVRRDRLRELLALPGPIALTQVALMLGYAEHATLTRSCRRWFGCTPRQLRSRLANADKPPAVASA